MSVVIPTVNRTREVSDCLFDLSTKQGAEVEVIIVQQGAISSPEFKIPAGLFVRILTTSDFNASLARNMGLREACGSVVLFLDDDVRIPSRAFLENHLRHYEDTSVPGVYGQVLEVGQATTHRPEPAEIETDWGWMNLPANYARACRTRNGGSGNLSVRRDWALAVGGMDAWFEKGARREETEFNLRLTKRYGPLVFDPEASLTHLSAEGGSRSWGHVWRTVPMHHIVGHWYFLLRAAWDRTLGIRGLSLEVKRIAIALLKNPQVGWNPAVFAVNLGRAGWGFGIAVGRLVRGPRRIDTVDSTAYSELRPRTAAE